MFPIKQLTVWFISKGEDGQPTDPPSYERVIGPYYCFVYFKSPGWYWDIWLESSKETCVAKGGPVSYVRAKKHAKECTTWLANKPERDRRRKTPFLWTPEPVFWTKTRTSRTAAGGNIDYTRIVGGYKCLVFYNIVGWFWRTETNDSEKKCIGRGGPVDRYKAQERATLCARRKMWCGKTGETKEEWTALEPLTKGEQGYERVIGDYKCHIHFNNLGWYWGVWTNDTHEECVGRGGPVNKKRAKAEARRCVHRLIYKSLTETD